MIQAWYIDDSAKDLHEPCHFDPPQYVDLDTLKEEIGVLNWKLDADKFPDDPELTRIRGDREYTYEDVIEIHKDKLPDYDAWLKKFSTEHLHKDEEIRYGLAGSGYLDVRSKEDKWIRIPLKKNLLLVLPAGIYHRFYLDTDRYIKAARYFCGEPVWTAYYRPSDDMEVRKEYVKKFKCCCC